MAIVDNKFTRQQTSFFKSHTPFEIPANTFSTNKISDMVYINYEIPTERIIINQVYGTEELFTFDIIIKNLTTNIPLEIEIKNEEYFLISRENIFIIEPLVEEKVSVEVNNTFINNLLINSSNNTDLIINVKNTISDLAFIPLQDSRPTRLLFNPEISVE
jgi:hypothetical protein